MNTGTNTTTMEIIRHIEQQTNKHHTHNICTTIKNHTKIQLIMFQKYLPFISTFGYSKWTNSKWSTQSLPPIHTQSTHATIKQFNWFRLRPPNRGSSRFWIHHTFYHELGSYFGICFLSFLLLLSNRTKLPSPMVSRHDFNIWSVLKNCIGNVVRFVYAKT